MLVNNSHSQSDPFSSSPFSHLEPRRDDLFRRPLHCSDLNPRQTPPVWDWITCLHGPRNSTFPNRFQAAHRPRCLAKMGATTFPSTLNPHFNMPVPWVMFGTCTRTHECVLCRGSLVGARRHELSGRAWHMLAPRWVSARQIRRLGIRSAKPAGRHQILDHVLQNSGGLVCQALGYPTGVIRVELFVFIDPRGLLASTGSA